MEFNLPEDLRLPTLHEVRRLTPNFAIQFPPEGPMLDKHAGRRQRNQLRRLGEYPKGNEPKPWSKRSRRKQNAAA